MAENRRNEITFSLTQLASFLVLLGGIISSWVTLNNSQIETNTKLIAFEGYYKNSLTEYKEQNEKANRELRLLIDEQKKLNKEMFNQLNDLERSVSQIYRISSRK